MSIKTDDEADFLNAAADASGVACATVKDGHVLIFKRSKLEEILKSLGPDKEKVVIFVKRPDMQG